MCERIAKFVIEGDPVPKGRPQVRMIPNGQRQIPHMYTPPKTQAYEKKVAEAYREYGCPFFDEGPLEMEVTFVIGVTKSWTKKKIAEALGGRYVTAKPDVDNLLKSLCDGLNGVAFADDSMIVKITAEKVYGVDGRTTVCLKRNM